MIFPIISKNELDDDFMRSPCLGRSAFLTDSEIESETFSKPSLIFSPCFFRSTF